MRTKRKQASEADAAEAQREILDFVLEEARNKQDLAERWTEFLKKEIKSTNE